MKPDKRYKTVYQHNKDPVTAEDMKKLVEIAEDYRKVKNYVYQRYGGIGSLSKIYPGYTVQNEMTESGLRSRLGMPAVYFYLAVFDALGDIKAQWVQTKNRVLQSLKQNEHMTPQDRHYLRFVMKTGSCFEAILTGDDIHLPQAMQLQYEEMSKGLDVRYLHNYLCRQVRKHLKKMHTDKAEGFATAERAYRYGDHGIYISIKEKRKRIWIPLTDGNQYKRQLYIQLYPEEGRIKICVPVEIKIKHHEEYQRRVGVAMGIHTMFVTDGGRSYGENYAVYQNKLTRYIEQGMRCYRKNRTSNPGRKKYYAGKDRLEAGLHTYVNAEINRMLRTEKPKIIYISKPPQTSKAGINKKINHSITMWQKGYIRNRLIQKCREQSIEVIEVLGKDISKECSNCGNRGEKKNGLFFCSACGLQTAEKINTAQNAVNRGNKPIDGAIRS